MPEPCGCDVDLSTFEGTPTATIIFCNLHGEAPTLRDLVAVQVSTMSGLESFVSPLPPDSLGGQWLALARLTLSRCVPLEAVKSWLASIDEVVTLGDGTTIHIPTLDELAKPSRQNRTGA